MQRGIRREIHNLEVAANCGSTPNLICNGIQQQEDDGLFPGGYVAYIVMTKVAGENLENYGNMEKSEQHRIQLAFLDALWDFQACHLYHHDARLQNVIWDPDLQKCYIVDLEDHELDSTEKPEDVCLDPWEHLWYWCLIPNDEIHEPTIFYSKEAMIQYYQEQLGH
ncbi:hypothetical protein BJY04DRAFT_201007 [Aspergillus karnatakaensis]|uniref:uncharacterized protein n=1 Tax=Aspergillus karnatakaensis TaxID=1810916 RepID=UPI003CCC9D76